MPPKSKKAKWTVNVTRRSADESGTLHVVATLLDDGRSVADLTITVTPDRALRVLVTNQPGAVGLSGFDAWEV